MYTQHAALPCKAHALAGWRHLASHHHRTSHRHHPRPRPTTTTTTTHCLSHDVHARPAPHHSARTARAPRHNTTRATLSPAPGGTRRPRRQGRKKSSSQHSRPQAQALGERAAHNTHAAACARWQPAHLATAHCGAAGHGHNHTKQGAGWHRHGRVRAPVHTARPHNPQATGQAGNQWCACITSRPRAAAARAAGSRGVAEAMGELSLRAPQPWRALLAPASQLRDPTVPAQQAQLQHMHACCLSQFTYALHGHGDQPKGSRRAPIRGARRKRHPPAGARSRPTQRTS